MTIARTYLDYNASAPLRPESREAFVSALDVVGNASSVHAEGRRARAIVERAREQVARLVNAKPSEIVFTSGATEANNWVLRSGWDRIILSSIEHDSVLVPTRAQWGQTPHTESRRSNRTAGCEGSDPIHTLPVGLEGVVSVAAIMSLATGGRTLLALQMANNETGVVQPVAEAAAIARERGMSVHTDAVQAPGRIAVDFRALGVETMSLSSHKIGGPKGAGALVIRDDINLSPFISGGGQERRRRAGTENIAAVAGFGAAAAAAGRDAGEASRMPSLRDKLEREVLRSTPAAVVLGAQSERLCNTSCIALPGLTAETLVIKLDLAGIAVSAGAACSSGKVGPSHVLAAMGIAPEIARGAIRVSIGHATTEHDIDAFLAAWREIAVSKTRALKVA